MTSPRLLVVTGPTAVGKSGLGLAVAERTGGDLISADSRQVYTGLNIGTATPTAAELARVRHHFVNERTPDRPFTAGQFAREAEDRIAAGLAQGRAPLVVGGSMLYVDALVRGIANLPGLPADLRDELASDARTERGRQALFDELQRADPDAAATLDPSKSHRLIRLVGVLRHAGRPSDFWRAAPPPRFTYRVVVLDRPRSDLYRRIDARVLAMLDDGLVEETQRLMAAGYSLDRSPLHTIGYAEVVAHLQGTLSYAEMTRLIQRNTRRFAKRQGTWLRQRYADAVWLDARTATPDSLLETISSAVG